MARLFATAAVCRASGIGWRGNRFDLGGVARADDFGVGRPVRGDSLAGFDCVSDFGGFVVYHLGMAALENRLGMERKYGARGDKQCRLADFGFVILRRTELDVPRVLWGFGMAAVGRVLFVVGFFGAIAYAFGQTIVITPNEHIDLNEYDNAVVVLARVLFHLQLIVPM